MTYSIVARDVQTGALGVAVQTAYFGVGGVVPWAEPGVGAVATQSFTEVSHGPLGLALMRGGRDAGQALRALLAADPEPRLRQVGLVDAAGVAAAHTGDRCVPAAGHASGEGVSVQANMMERDTVWGAMLAAFEASAGPLAERLLGALVAAEREGGDIRGRQSAALLVVGGSRGTPAWRREVDLRVDDHREPVPELARLLRLHRAFEALEAMNDLVAAGDFEGAAREGDRALGLAPDDTQVAFWAGLTMAGAGRIDEARALVDRAASANPRWAAFLRRFPTSGLIPDMPELFDALMPLPGAPV
jgi:uncharacterized Ntn-hydrolase superfamily protein